jgi:hypothetical protein
MDTAGLIVQAEARATAKDHQTSSSRHLPDRRAKSLKLPTKLRETKMMSAPSTNPEKCFKAHCGENTTRRDRGRERESLMGVGRKGGRTAELNP